MMYFSFNLQFHTPPMIFTNKWSSLDSETLGLDLQHINSHLFLRHIDIFLSASNIKSLKPITNKPQALEFYLLIQSQVTLVHSSLADHSNIACITIMYTCLKH